MMPFFMTLKAYVAVVWTTEYMGLVWTDWQMLRCCCSVAKLFGYLYVKSYHSRTWCDKVNDKN